MTLWQYLAAFNNPLFYKWGKKTDKHAIKVTDLFKSFLFESSLLNLGIFKATSCNIVFKRTLPNAEFKLLCNKLKGKYLKEGT